MIAYSEFLAAKAQLDGDHGFAPSFMPDALFPFQAALVEWAVRKGRAALLEDCGLGKTLQELVWAQNVTTRANKAVLLLTPLAVAPQVVAEGEKFGIEVARSIRGEIRAPIVATNYERLHLFSPDAFAGAVCDESSILKGFDGSTRKHLTEFLRRMPYRLLGTATAAPNDYIELGTSSEALGALGHVDMLARFFTNDRTSRFDRAGRGDAWRLKGHAETAFWRWVASWARALRRPSDLGFADDGFALPPLSFHEHVVAARTTRPGMLLDLPASGFREEREERRRTIAERCERAAALVADTGQPAVIWCHLNPEGDLLERLIPDAVQVSGRDSDDEKEAKFLGFAAGQVRVLICKPVIGAWGLNWQHCAHVVTFPSHSFEQFYQAIRRCWRFGQARPVTVDIVLTEGETAILKNLWRKQQQAERMFAELVAHMRDELVIQRVDRTPRRVEVPSWLTA